MSSLKAIIYQKLPEILLISLLGIVLFSSVNRYHDWGGDFAQYLNNAKDLVEGKPYQQPEILDHENFSPLSRGAGFSLLLAVLYPIFKESIAHYTCFISLMLLIASVCAFQYFKQLGIYKVPSFLFALIFALHPYVIIQKLEILPTFPFLALLLMGIHCFQKQTEKPIVLLGIIGGLLISLRNVGWVFILAVLIHMTISLLKHFQWRTVIQIVLLLAITIVVDQLIKWIVFRGASFENIFWYQSVFTPQQMLSKFRENIFYYYDLMHVFFRQYVVAVSHTYFEKFFLVLVFIGFLLRLKNWQMMDTFFVLYLLLVLSYFWQSGMRFLVPILPIILTYLAFTIQWLSNFLGIKRKIHRVIVHTILPIIFFLGLTNQTKTFINYAASTIAGPQTTLAQEAFRYVESRVAVEEPVAFHKPWVLHHYTDRISMAINPKNGITGFSMSYLVNKMKQFKVNYILVSSDQKDLAVYNDELYEGVQNDPRFKEHWRNDAFVFLSFTDDISSKNPAMK